MGSVLLRAGAYAKAEEQYRAILQVSPDDIDAQVGLAAALRAQADAKSPADSKRRARMLTKVLEKDPHNIAALFNLGVLYADFLKKPARRDAALQALPRPMRRATTRRARTRRSTSPATAAAATSPAPPPRPSNPQKGGK